MSLTIQEGVKMCTQHYTKQCDQTAKRLLKTYYDTAKRRVMKDIESVRYTTSNGALIVCRDGAALYADTFVSATEHRTAFRIGLRTSETEIFNKF